MDGMGMLLECSSTILSHQLRFGSQPGHEHPRPSPEPVCNRRIVYIDTLLAETLPRSHPGKVRSTVSCLGRRKKQWLNKQIVKTNVVSINLLLGL